MSELLILPSTTYRPSTPPQARRAGRSLNTIIEEQPDESQQRPVESDNRRMQAPSSNDKIVQWLSPQSDHFPTPRGFHFLSAPILPESPTAASADESNSPSIISSNAWNRQSVSTDVTEFGDIYDVSDDEANYRRHSRTPSVKRTNSSRSGALKKADAQSLAPQQTLPPLVIPAQPEQKVNSPSGRPDLKKIRSPVPPTPPAKVEMSPAAMSFMQAQQTKDVPTISAPPSLDGSLSSEQMATMSAPPTPVMGAGEDESSSGWAGVQLQPAALATLQALSGGGDENEQGFHSEQVIEMLEERVPEMSQQTPRAFTSMRPELSLSTEQQQSLNGLTRLSIPSPGGFFSGLSPRARHTWHLPSMTPDDIAPPTSTTAEQFYRCPWNQPAPPVPALPSIPLPPSRPQDFSSLVLPPPPPRPVGQIVEGRGTMSDGMATARPAMLEQIVEARDIVSEGPPTARRIESVNPLTFSPVSAEPVSPKEGEAATEIVTVYDPEYAEKLRNEALSNLDRTELWLMAQKAYLSGVLPEEDAEPESEPTKTPEVEAKDEPEVGEAGTGSDASPAQKKKTVRFSEIIVKSNIPCSLPSKLLRQESAYYRAFQDYVIQSRGQDAFVHRLPRFEALQAQRVSLREAHRNQLLGKYQLSVVPQSAKKRMSANVARGDHVLSEDDPEKIRLEREAEARRQMAAAAWHVGTLKALNGGRLFSAPVEKRLRRLSMRPVCNGSGGGDRARILDLGGQATCDWAWHCAIAYPGAKVYTATTKAIRQLSNSNIRGPPNHRQVAVERLTRLPFPDAHFDLVSARELHSILKFVGENGTDEWEGALAECLRVLKPGGYLDFSVQDSDLMNAGPLGLAKSVEFGFTLKTLGYDPQPTRLFLGRLGRAGFEGVRRAWTCLPVGARPTAGTKTGIKTKTNTNNAKGQIQTRTVPVPAAGGRTVELDALVTGSTDAAAGVAGLAGGWAWERWLLRCEMEKVASEGRLVGTQEMREAGKCLEDVQAVIEEGRRCGAGWRVLTGFAMKPKA
ncbi:hypothetical protein DL768_007137 [Monosporascus sp. mg162]|nr:hypothetical protein DL768_007137 [Monosporascus sp. mg162]